MVKCWYTDCKCKKAAWRHAHCLTLQLLKLWCGSPFPNMLLAEFCLRKLEMFVLRWLLFLVVFSVCCCPGAATSSHRCCSETKLINPARLIWLGPDTLEYLALTVVLCSFCVPVQIWQTSFFFPLPALYLSLSHLVLSSWDTCSGVYCVQGYPCALRSLGSLVVCHVWSW